MRDAEAGAALAAVVVEASMTACFPRWPHRPTFPWKRRTSNRGLVNHGLTSLWVIDGRHAFISVFIVSRIKSTVTNRYQVEADWVLGVISTRFEIRRCWVPSHLRYPSWIEGEVVRRALALKSPQGDVRRPLRHGETILTHLFKTIKLNIWPKTKRFNLMDKKLTFRSSRRNGRGWVLGSRRRGTSLSRFFFIFSVRVPDHRRHHALRHVLLSRKIYEARKYI